MKPFLFYFLLFLSGIRVLYSQQCECPLYTKTHDRIDVLLERVNYEGAEKLAMQLIDTENLVCKLFGLNELFRIYSPQKKSLKMEALLKEQLRLSNRVECDSTKWLGEYYLNASIYNYQVSNYAASVEYGYKAISIKEDLNDIDAVLKAKQILVQTLSYMNRDMEAAKVVVQNYSLIMKSDDSFQKADNIVWLIKHYDVFYNTTGDPAYLDTMRILCDKARNISQRFGNRPALLQAYLSTDIVCYYEGNYKKGIAYLDSALIKADYRKDGKELARLHLSRAWDFISMGNTYAAKFEHDSAMYYFNGFYQPYEISLGYTDGAEIYALAGDFKMAYQLYQRGITLRDSVTSVNTSNKIAELEQKYNKEVNERRIKDLSQENQIAEQKQRVANLRLRLLLGVVVLIFLLVIIAIFFVRQRMLQQKNRTLQMEQKLNRSRMNPHFFFNALTSLQQLAMDPNRQKEVPSYIGKYAKIMRQTLESSFNDLVSLEEEMDYINKYLQIQTLRFPGKFTYKIEVDEKLDEFETLVPSMLLQPFIENSIEHGFQDINYQGELMVSVRHDQGKLHFMVLDNGTKGNHHSPHHGYPSRATQIVGDRLRLLNQIYRSKAYYTISRGNEGRGYRIDLYLPYLKG